jgi:hypothetical protein
MCFDLTRVRFSAAPGRRCLVGGMRPPPQHSAREHGSALAVPFRWPTSGILNEIHDAPVEHRTEFPMRRVDRHWDLDTVLSPTPRAPLGSVRHDPVKAQISRHPAAWTRDLARVGNVLVGHSSSSTRFEAGQPPATTSIARACVANNRRSVSASCWVSYTPKRGLMQARSPLFLQKVRPNRWRARGPRRRSRRVV